MNVMVSLDGKYFNHKPDSYEIVKIKERAVSNWSSIDIDKLSDCVGNHGVGFVPGHLVNGMKASNCTEMQVFALDFDGTTTFSVIKERCEYWGIPISFAYKTFSSTPKMERFRIVFVHDPIIKDPYIIRIVIDMLLKIFPEADRNCRNIDRVFIGGKQLIYLDKEAIFSSDQLLSPFYNALEKNDNLTRDLRSFCNKHHIVIVNNRAAMEKGLYLNTLIENDGLRGNPIIHTIGDPDDPSFFVLENTKTQYSSPQKHRKKDIDLSNCSGCQLLEDFTNGEDVGHDARFAILTNLMNIEGGQKFFFDVLEKSSDTERFEKWKRDQQYMRGYLPQRCGDFCPYMSDCINNGTIKDTITSARRVYKIDQDEYYDTDEAYDSMVRNLTEAINSNEGGIHLIKAATGLGKTKAYTDYIKKHYMTDNKKYLICVPTHILQKQVADSFSGIPHEDIFITPKVKGENLFPKELQQQITDFHSSGFHRMTKEFIAEFYETIKDNPEKKAVVEECKLIMDGMNAIQDQRIVITTHAYFIQMPRKRLKNYIIIIDEDILQEYFFSQIKKVSINLLEVLSSANIPYYSDTAKLMLSVNLNKCDRNIPSPFTPELSMDQIEEYGLWCDVDNNINDLRYATTFVNKEEDGEKYVLYYCPPKLPNLKYIVLSATLDPEIYKAFFKNMEIHIYNEKKPKYTGKIIQFTYNSLSRANLKDKTLVFDFVRKLSSNDKIPIITFLKYQNFAGKNNHNLHFGNALGMNSLKGQDLAIIGTPYCRDECYKLVAFYLGSNVNQKADQSPRPRRVTYNGYSFIITTYSDPLLQRIQLYSLLSELEQAVGRARVLRYNCTVYVFSSFPVDQAEIHTENYLLNKNKNDNCNKAEDEQQ